MRRFFLSILHTSFIRWERQKVDTLLISFISFLKLDYYQNMTFPMSREWLRNLISDYGRHRLFFIWNWTQIFYELSTSQYKESKVPEHKEILRYFCSIFERFFSHVKLQSNYCTYSHIWVSTLYVKFCTKHDQKGKERQIARNTSTILPSWHLFGFMSIITKIRKGMLGHLSFMIKGEEGRGSCSLLVTFLC